MGEGWGPQGGPTVGSRNIQAVLRPEGQKPGARLEVSADSSFD